MDEPQVSGEKKLTLLLLCYTLFGCFGIHRFYIGRYGTGLLMLLTFGGLGLWMHVDTVLIIMGKFTDKDGRPIVNWV
jgi:TM2 domain-containing membrane protein YozV